MKGRVARALLNLAEAFGKDVGNGRILIRQKPRNTPRFFMSVTAQLRTGDALAVLLALTRERNEDMPN